MKRNNILAVVLLCVAMVSCSKEKGDGPVYDVLKGLSAYNTISFGEAGVVLSDGRFLYAGSTPGAFFPYLGKANGKDVAVTARINTDPALLHIYDSLYRSTSPVLADGLFSLANGGKCTITAGQLKSADSIGVIAGNTAGMAPGAYRYVVPVALESTPANVLKSQLMFVKYNLTVTNAFITSASTGRNNIQLTVYSTIPQTASPLIRVNLDKAIGTTAKFGVEAIASDALTAAYNAKFQTNYKPFPANSWMLTSDSATVAANTTSSANGSSPIFRPDPTKFPTGSTYLLALKIKGPKNDELTAAEIVASTNVIFAIITAQP